MICILSRKYLHCYFLSRTALSVLQSFPKSSQERNDRLLRGKFAQRKVFYNHDAIAERALFYLDIPEPPMVVEQDLSWKRQRLDILRTLLFVVTLLMLANQESYNDCTWPNGFGCRVILLWSWTNTIISEWKHVWASNHFSKLLLKKCPK